MSSGRPQWRGSDNLLRSPGSGARHSPAHRLDAVGAEGRSRRVRRRRGAREGLSPLSARGVGQAPAAAQPSRKSQPSSPDANPVQEVAGTVVWHGWVPLGPTERPPGARQTCFWALFQRSRANHSWDEPAPVSGVSAVTSVAVPVSTAGVRRRMSLSVPIEKQTLVMKSSLLKDDADLELGTPTVARLGQPTEVLSLIHI